MKDAVFYREKLQARLDELTERLDGLEHELHQPADPDVEERAVERETDEMLESLGSSGLDEIKAINAALERVHSGSFGICTVCGGPISDARLDLVPYAALCRTCAGARI